MKIFRPFRQDSNNNFSYLKYAIDEIFLVAVGILIALQVNNLNQSRIEEKAMNDYFQKIVNIQECFWMGLCSLLYHKIALKYCKSDQYWFQQE